MSLEIVTQELQAKGISDQKEIVRRMHVGMMLAFVGASYALVNATTMPVPMYRLNFDPRTNNLQFDNLLDELKLNHEQLIALGILIGTDFNSGGVKGIGPKKALKLVQNYKDVNGFEKMFSELNVDFNWKEIYEIFSNLPYEKNIKLKWEGINEDLVREILVNRHEFNLERINNLIIKYKEENKTINQKGLSDFF